MSRSNTLSILFAIIALVAGGGFLVFGTIALAGVTMSVHGWIALGLGIVVSLALGTGLTTVLVISRRRGYDEAAYNAGGLAPSDDQV
ncbi:MULTISPECIES: hypothetical protein [Maricaulis]|jgi:hypothetical protein|uniref:Uncharacterized protein n=1 Tax=Maricaulis maris (strain MCS10) TaxID=394221 RepID=Q0ART0_MARMM|nr:MULTISPECIES: hypothetical protein [Maricaulis]ABI65007.1 conserved hypothetical protein [Maricaulis maris MCS10]MAC90750.1 hypothetical protein [Maricaulis sp.]